MGLDARVRYTKLVIKDAFISLLKEKPLNKVTVKEICALAGINRATFYRYYCDFTDAVLSGTGKRSIGRRFTAIIATPSTCWTSWSRSSYPGCGRA